MLFLFDVHTPVLSAGDIAAGLDSGIVRVWHVATGEKLRDFTGHGGTVKALAFAPGDRLFSASLDGTGFLWDVSRLKPKEEPAKLAKDALDAAWASLLGDDGKKAFETLTRLTATPDLAVELFRTRLKTSGTADAKVIEKVLNVRVAFQIDIRIWMAIPSQEFLDAKGIGGMD